MGFGELPADWRDRRAVVHASFKSSPERPILRFVDVQASATLRHLEKALAGLLNVYGYKKLNLPIVAGADRRITRWISKYVQAQKDDDGVPLFAGIRYLSRMGTDWECWAVFQGVEIVRESTASIAVDDATFQKVAKHYGLKAF